MQTFELALRRFQEGNLQEAGALCQALIGQDPRHADALHLLALMKFQIGDYLQSEGLFQRAVDLRPHSPSLLTHYGLLLQALQRSDEAVETFKKALANNSDFVSAYFNLGLTLQSMKRYEEAIQAFDQAISKNRLDAESFYRRGLILSQMNRHEEAVQSFQQALAIKPDFSDAAQSLGVSLCSLRRFSEALVCFDRVIQARPNHAEAFYNRGYALHGLCHYQKAVEQYERAIEINPNFAEAFYNHGADLHELNRFDEAVQSYTRAIELRADFAEAFNARGASLVELQQFEAATADYRKAQLIKPDYFEVQSNLIFSTNYVPFFSPLSRLELTRQFGINVAQAVTQKYESWNLVSSIKKIRIGFVSGDFRNHPIGWFLENVLAHIDNKKFELIAYSNNPFEDELTIRLKTFFQSFKNIFGVPDAAAARMIHDDGIQILIDLSGHTTSNRLPLFAYKPAPMQISWLGYCGTTGVQEIDYILADVNVIPAHEEHYFCEKIKRIKDIYLCLTPPKVNVMVQDLPALRNGYLTFGCFNNFCKVNEDVLSLFIDVLRAVEGSHLFLKSRHLKNPSIKKDLVSFFVSRGIAASKLIFEGFVGRDEHFQSFNQVDISLDTFPYNGVTTSAESLWMGVPVLTLAGNCFLSRNGETIARNVGLSDWIAEDRADYINKAVRFSSDIESLSRLRSGLRAHVLSSPLFDAENFARHFEDAMVEIINEYRK